MIMNMNRLTAGRHLRSTIARSCAVHQRAALSSASTLSGVVATTTVAPSSTATHWRTTTSSVGSPAWSSVRAFSTKDRTPLEKDSNSLNQATPYNICFLRHGQSTWNRDNRFIGWTDTPLTEDGIVEARVAGDVLRNSGLLFDEVHTSLLRRSIRTVNICLMEMGQEYIPVYKHWRLNERSYGDLVGLNKKEVVKQYGADQVKRWRRSFDEPPPPMNVDHPYHPRLEPRYRTMLDEIPKSESLKDTLARSRVYWDETIAPKLQQGKTLLVVGHENNLRSLIMRLEDIPEDDIINLNLPRAVPLAYRLDKDLKPLDRPDGKLDSATGFLRGVWLGGDDAVSEILDRDDKQVYDTTIQANLETDPSREQWKKKVRTMIGNCSPEAKDHTHPGTFQEHDRDAVDDDDGGHAGSRDMKIAQ